jgi:hypothetical protein
MGEAGPSQYNLTRRVLNTEQPDNAQGFFSSVTLLWSTECRYKTLLDSNACRHRRIFPNCHVPDLSHYIRDKVRPRGRGRSKTDHSIPFTFAQHQGQRNLERGALRAPPPHPVVFLLSNEGKAPPAVRRPKD